MKIHLNAVAVAVGIVALLALSVLPEARLSAQITGTDTSPDCAAERPDLSPRMANGGKPDFQGVWQRP